MRCVRCAYTLSFSWAFVRHRVHWDDEVWGRSRATNHDYDSINVFILAHSLKALESVEKSQAKFVMNGLELALYAFVYCAHSKQGEKLDEQAKACIWWERENERRTSRAALLELNMTRNPYTDFGTAKAYPCKTDACVFRPFRPMCANGSSYGRELMTREQHQVKPLLFSIRHQSAIYSVKGSRHKATYSGLETRKESPNTWRVCLTSTLWHIYSPATTKKQFGFFAIISHLP